MKNLITYLLLPVFLIQILGSVITLAAYEINKSYIAKTFCVNKNNPKRHCNGKCHLIKELQKENKRDNSPANSLKDKNETIQYFELFTNAIVWDHEESVTKHFRYLESKTYIFKSAIFHPPLA